MPCAARDAVLDPYAVLAAAEVPIAGLGSVAEHPAQIGDAAECHGTAECIELRNRSARGCWTTRGQHRRHSRRLTRTAVPSTAAGRALWRLQDVLGRQGNGGLLLEALRQAAAAIGNRSGAVPGH